MLAAKIVIFLGLFFSFFGLFYLLRKSQILKSKLREAYDSIDSTSMQRAKEHKRNLAIFEEQSGIVGRLERRFLYSGLGSMFRFLTLELWLVIRILIAVASYFISFFLLRSWLYGLVVAIASLGVLYVIESLLIHKNYKAVDENLLEFLNILGNYSVTAGEVTGIFNKVSWYMREPLKSALNECYYEAKTTGNTNMALLTLADKIEHPRFKELIKNIEVCARYSANFSLVVKNSRKVLQQHVRARQERKGMAQEAMLNMFVTLLMLLIVFIVVDKFLNASMWHVLCDTTIGRIALLAVATLVLSFVWQIMTTDR